MKKPKIVYYTTPYGYGHVVRANAIIQAIGDRADVHLIAAIDIIFDLAKNIHFHKIDEIPGSVRFDCPIYYEDKEGKTPSTSSGKHIEEFRTHTRKFVDLLCDINPDLVIIDVTPEFAIFAKILGFESAQVLITGKRDDLRNKVSLCSVDHVIVPYPENFVDLSYLPAEARKNIFYSGAFSRFDGKRIISKDDAKKKLGIPSDKKLVVCAFGRGDLGGKVVKKVEEIAKSKEFADCQFKIFGNIPNVDEYLNAADFAISGAGDNTVMENCYYRVPMIMIPLKRRYDEQVLKAEALEKIGAGKIILEDEIDSKLQDELRRLISDEGYREEAAKAEGKFVDGHGAERLADEIIRWTKLS